MQWPAKKRKAGVPKIPSVWFALLPGQSLAFWIDVAKRAKTRRVRKHDYTKIKQLAKEIAYGSKA